MRRFHALLSHGFLRMRFGHRRLCLLQSCAGLVALTRRQRTQAHQFLHPRHVGLGFFQHCFGIGNAGIAGDDGGLVRCQALLVVVQIRFGSQHLRVGLFDFLLVNARVDLHQRRACGHIFEILHIHTGHIACDLWADDGGLAAHIGIVGADHRTLKRRQFPRIQHQGNRHQTNGYQYRAFQAGFFRRVPIVGYRYRGLAFALVGVVGRFGSLCGLRGFFCRGVCVYRPLFFIMRGC